MSLSEEQIAKNLDDVKKIQVYLDEDPLSKGLVSVNNKLSEIQIAKDKVSSLLMDAMKNLAEHEILKDMAQNEHDRQQDLFIATDKDVQAQKSAEQRSIHARLKMPELVLKVHHTEIALLKASWYLKCLQLVASNLESANSNLSRQITVIQMDLNLQGGNVGAQRSTTKTLNF
jgi:hypothetical protein